MHHSFPQNIPSQQTLTLSPQGIFFLKKVKYEDEQGHDFHLWAGTETLHCRGLQAGEN